MVKNSTYEKEEPSRRYRVPCPGDLPIIIGCCKSVPIFETNRHCQISDRDSNSHPAFPGKGRYAGNFEQDENSGLLGELSAI